MSVSKIFIPNFVCVLPNKRYKTYQTGLSFCCLGHAPGVRLRGGWGCPGDQKKFFIPRQSRRDIVLASSVRLSVRPSVHTFCLSGTISQYLLVRFNSFLVQMISTMNSRYPISLVKIDPLTLELLPLFKYRQL